MRGQIRQRAHIVAMSPQADPPASRTRNDSPRYLYFYCEEIRLGDDTSQTQFGCIRHKTRTVTHSENNTSQMIYQLPLVHQKCVRTHLDVLTTWQTRPALHLS